MPGGCANNFYFEVLINSDSCETLSTNETNYETDDSLNLYPNPTSDFLYFNKKADFIKIFNVNGALINTYSYTDIIDLKNYSNGIYFTVIEIDTIEHVFRVVKE